MKPALLAAALLAPALSARALDGQIHTIAVARLPASGEKNPNAEGFIQRWLILIIPRAGDKVAVATPSSRGTP